MKLYFGPNYRYFFDDGKGNFKYRAPPNFLDLFRTVRMRSIEHVAFGVGDSFFISYCRAIDGQYMYHFQHDNHYDALKSWLFDEGLDHGNTAYVSLGNAPDSFFAASKQGHRWRDIPTDACDFYQKRTRADLFARSRVNTIDLGHNNTFLGITIDNTWFWDLGNEYKTLEALDVATNIVKANWVMISPFAPDVHFIVFEDGTVHYALPKEWAGDIANLMQQYASQQQQQQQQQQNNSYGRPTISSAYASTSSSAAYQYSYSSPPSYIQQSRPPQQQQQQKPPSDINEGMQLANNVLDAYNNATNAGGNTTTSTTSSSYSGGGSFDVNQAMSLAQSSIQTVNNLSGSGGGGFGGMGGQGLDLVNTVTQGGLLVGQLAGTAAACVVM